MELLTAIREVLELGWPAIVLIAIWIIWQRHNRRTDELIANLREEREMWKEQYRALFVIVVDRAKLSDQVYERERLQVPRARQVKHDVMSDEDTVVFDRDSS